MSGTHSWRVTMGPYTGWDITCDQTSSGVMQATVVPPDPPRPVRDGVYRARPGQPAYDEIKAGYEGGVDALATALVRVLEVVRDGQLGITPDGSWPAIIERAFEDTVHTVAITSGGVPEEIEVYARDVEHACEVFTAYAEGRYAPGWSFMYVAPIPPEWFTT